MTTKRFIVVPGYVISQYDGERHHVSAAALMKCHNVRRDECIVIRDAGDEWKRRGLDKSKMITLFPRDDGNYKNYGEQ